MTTLEKAKTGLGRNVCRYVLWIGLLVLLGTISIPTIAATSNASEESSMSESIVFDTDFDQVRAGNLPSRWAGAGQVVHDVTFEGLATLYMNDSNASGYAEVNTPPIPVEGGSTYVLTASAKVDDPNRGGDVAIFVRELKSGTSGVVHYVWFPRSGSWDEFTLEFTVSAETTHLRLSFYPAARGAQHTGAAWFGPVQIRRHQPQTSRKVESTTLNDGFGRPVPVSMVEDVGERLAPEDFWNRVPVPAELKERIDSGTPAPQSVWAYPLMRRFFFGADFALPQRVYERHSTMPRLEKTLGVRVPSNGPHYAIAEDIRFNPIVRAHPATTATYSPYYYPRRMHDWINGEFHPAYVLTGDDWFMNRMQDFLNFLMFSQYDAEGNNEFTSTYFPEEYARLQESGISKEWRGGWDYLFDWVWPDAYGYTWQLHEPDHHVNSQIAVAMVRAFEVTGEEKYLDAAAHFVYHQVPRYGWHTGVWNERRYYWTEYNPSGPENPTMDATDNIQALVSHAVAMVGYYRKDARLLEYARGLLWYLVREFTTDGRWYYDGAENPLNQRRAESHDMATLLPSLGALPYLLKAGLSLEPEMEGLQKALEWYVLNDSTVGDLRFGQAYKLAGPIGDEGTWRFTTYYHLPQLPVTGLRISDFLPPEDHGFEAPVEVLVRLSRLMPPQGSDHHWHIDPHKDVVYRFDGAEAQKGFSVVSPFELERGDIVRLSYEVKRASDEEVALPYLTSALLRVQLAGAGWQTLQAQTPSSRYAIQVNDETFVTLGAKLNFPFKEELAGTLVLSPAPSPQTP